MSTILANETGVAVNALNLTDAGDYAQSGKPFWLPFNITVPSNKIMKMEVIRTSTCS